ncbi:hypothetical protein LJR175_000717 [Variovorax sp. LjRoot175]
MIWWKLRFVGVCIFAGLMSILTGCASVTQGLEQSVRIETLTSAGKAVEGAQCQLSNDKGTAMAVSGQSALVRRSGGDLSVLCELAGQPSAVGQAVSRANAGLAGNVLIGGGIGAVIDATSGAAYTYPTWMQLVFGEERLFDRSGHRDEGPVSGTFVRATGPATTAELARPSDPSVPPVAAAPSVAASGIRAPLRRGDALEYVLIDQMTGNKSPVIYRLDQVTANEMSFNQGARVERIDGQVVLIRSPAGGIFDTSSPPGGWARANVRPGMAWSEEYPRHSLRATVSGESSYKIGDEDVRVVKIQYAGWQNNTVMSNGAAPRSSQMEVTVLYAPDLKRVVRFDAETKAIAGMTKESLQLQRILRN